MQSKSWKNKAKRGQRRSAPITANGTVPPRRVLNKKRRPREYLTVKEVELLMDSARKRGRYRHRDATMILIAYRHGLRASELATLRWDQFDFGARALARAAREEWHAGRCTRWAASNCGRCGNSSARRSKAAFVFMTERAAPITTAGFRKMIARTGESAEFPFPVHPHMLRHACGYKLANDGQDTRAVQHYLGHRNIQHTVRYTELSPERFKSFWED